MHAMFSGKGQHRVHAYCKILPKWALDSKANRGESPGIILFCPINTVHSDSVPMLSCGRNGTDQARAHVSQFVHMPDFACFQNHTSQLSRPTPAATFPNVHISRKKSKTLFAMMQTTRHLLTIVAVCVLDECVTQ
jgi:hypothetical protein